MGIHFSVHKTAKTPGVQLHDVYTKCLLVYAGSKVFMLRGGIMDTSCAT